jgi:hypothetical protein
MKCGKYVIPDDQGWLKLQSLEVSKIKKKIRKLRKILVIYNK